MWGRGSDAGVDEHALVLDSHGGPWSGARQARARGGLQGGVSRGRRDLEMSRIWGGDRPLARASGAIPSEGCQAGRERRNQESEADGGGWVLQLD